MNEWSEREVVDVRLDTPGASRVVHLNNAGASLMPAPVVAAMQEHLQQEAEMGGYEAAEAAIEAMGDAYSATADLIGATIDEIAITENATRAFQMGLFSIPFQRGDRILTTEQEYSSNLISYAQLARRHAVEIVVIPSDHLGGVSVDRLEAALDNRVRLVSITHVPTNSGLVQPLADVANVVRDHPALLLVDACQSIGQMPVNVQDLGVDLLCGTSRKYLRGPRGVGFLYVNNRALPQLEPPLLDLVGANWLAEDTYSMRRDARRFETWESNVAARIAFGVAVKYALEIGIERAWQRIHALGDYLRASVSAIPHVTVHDVGILKCGIVTFSAANLPATTVHRTLADHGVNVSISRKSSTPIDMAKRDIEEVLRASVHYYNTETEIGTFVEILGRTAK